MGGWRGVRLVHCLLCVRTISYRLRVSMGRAATGAARGAARIVSTPLRVAQRSYAVLGRQGFLSSAGILPADPGALQRSLPPRPPPRPPPLEKHIRLGTASP
jgi:hypothetical protein